jgi:cell division protein FtsB|tara:strand:- start:67 stop:417 length:351 start_codon:yes stop_codon:yes gene_type:complete
MANMKLVHRICELEDEVKKLSKENHCLKANLFSLENTLTDMTVDRKLFPWRFPEPLDAWRQETDKNISELKKVTEYLSAIHRKELDMIEAHEAIHRIHAEEIRRKQEANSEGESSE